MERHCLKRMLLILLEPSLLGYSMSKSQVKRLEVKVCSEGREVPRLTRLGQIGSSHAVAACCKRVPKLSRRSACIVFCQVPQGRLSDVLIRVLLLHSQGP